MKTVLAIAVGGSLGAVARYYFSIGAAKFLGTALPWGTSLENLIGCFAMGVLAELMDIFWMPSEEIKAFLTIGFLGAFTTFSTFSLDFALFHGRGELLMGGLYVLTSVIASIGGVFLGMLLIRVIFQ